MPAVENSRPPVFNFTSPPSTSSFTASSQTFLSNHPSTKYKYIATGALVFDNSNHIGPRILLIQRSESDSMPGRWEVPGGGCDDDDESILHGVARELWEETGLSAAKIGPLVGKPHCFASRSGKQVCKFNFSVEAEQTTEGRLEVKLNPVEHQKFVWASEEEVRAREVGDVELEFTTRDLEDAVLEAFRLRSEREPYIIEYCTTLSEEGLAFVPHTPAMNVIPFEIPKYPWTDDKDDFDASWERATNYSYGYDPNFKD